MKVIFHKDFHHSYVADPAAATGRVEAVLKAIRGKAELVEAVPASPEDIAAVHTPSHIEEVRRERLYDIAALAAGGAVQAAMTGLTEPCFALIRPPGHHASAGAPGASAISTTWPSRWRSSSARDSSKRPISWTSISTSATDGEHPGRPRYVTIHNPSAAERTNYLRDVEQKLFAEKVDLIGVSAGFDNHLEDWGGLLATEDYRKMGKMVRRAAREHGGGCFGILEGGYNHGVLGQNVLAFLEGMEEG
jgi:acetoin utilization deacetylase AcuC-like enzyme